MGLKQAILRAAHEAGAFALARRVYRRKFLGATVLLFHRVLPAGAPRDHYVRKLGDPDPAQLEAYLSYLKRWFRFSTPGECVERWRRGREVDPYTLLLTFDDGYRDMFDNLLPVLRRCAVPATVFVATGPVGGGRPIWPQRLFSAVQTTHHPALPPFEGLPAMPLRDVAERVAAMEAVAARQLGFAAPAWEVVIDRLCEALEWDGRVDGERMLDWSQVEALHRSGLVTVGGHTVTHPLLERCDPEQARGEVFGCADELRRRLRPAFLPFSYPQGRCPPTRIQELVREAGFDCAFTGRFTENNRTTPLFQLGRRHVPADNLPRASLWLSGAGGPAGAPAPTAAHDEAPAHDEVPAPATGQQVLN